MAQCAASASGRPAQCNPNPFYGVATAPLKPNVRRYRQVVSTSPAPAVTGPDSYCLQGRQWGYPGNRQFNSYAHAWPPRAVLTPIAGSIPSTRSRTGGTALIGPDTERQRCRALRQCAASCRCRDSRGRPRSGSASPRSARHHRNLSNNPISVSRSLASSGASVSRVIASAFGAAFSASCWPARVRLTTGGGRPRDRGWFRSVPARSGGRSRP